MKVPDAVIKVKDLELVEFMDAVQTILNNGLYELRIFDGVPNWQANQGENGIVVTSDNRQLYFYLNNTWCSIGFNSLGNLVLFDKNQDTGITPEATPNEDVIRFYTAGYYNYLMGTVGFGMAAGKACMFDGTTGDYKWVYDSASKYLCGYTHGFLRFEI